MRASGQAFGPSESASSGRGWVSMNRPATPAATAARASTGTNSRWPPEACRPAPPGSCTEWVASNTTGQPVARMIGERAHVGDQVVVAEAEAALAHHDLRRCRCERALSTTLRISHGERNWPFLMLTGLPGAATRRMKLVCRHRNAGRLQHIDHGGDFRERRVLVHIGEHRHAERRCAPTRSTLQPGCQPGPRKLAREERLALSKEALKMKRHAQARGDLRQACRRSPASASRPR